MLDLRPTRESDYDGVMQCLARNGMPTWPADRWSALWDAYPYRADFQDVPRGYVLDVDGRIVGSISSIWGRYVLGGRELRTINAARVAVDPEHRASSIHLFGAQLLQGGIDLYLNGSASAATSRIMETLKVPRVPQPSNDTLLLWAANATRVADAGLRRRRIPLAPVVAPVAGAVLRIARGRALARVGRPRHPVERLDAFTDEFDVLWSTLRARATALLGFRDAPTLRWRFGRQLRTGDGILLAARRGDALAGYAVLIRTPRPTTGLLAFVMHDVQYDGDEGVLASLLYAAIREVGIQGGDLLEWSGFTGPKRALAERASALRYHLEFWQAFYYARDQQLRSELASPDRWDFSPYDSD